MSKYTYLIFIEFQEMLCRMAYLGIREVEKVEFRVYILLESIYDFQKNKSKQWTKDQFELKNVN